MSKRGAGTAYIRITNSKAQFNFVWIFAILVGAAILFFAISGALKAGKTTGVQQDSEIARQLSNIIDPLQAGFSEGSFGKISFRTETRISNYCFDDGVFGRNEISVSTRSNIGDEWGQEGIANEVYSKYIFSSNRISGKEYYVFSRPFKIPYEVTDMIMITSKDYCFINAPEEIVDEIKGMGIPNIEIETCEKETAEKVCFGPGGPSDCDMIVTSCGSGCDEEYEAGTVIKKDENLEYSGNLLYAAIFSEKEIYDCNVKRLRYRAARIAEELTQKADLMDAKGCGTNMGPRLNIWKTKLEDTQMGLKALLIDSKILEKDNRREVCGVWE